MRVLWFEVTVPSRYRNAGIVIGGWQDSLENIVRECPEIELYIAFETNDDAPKKTVGNVVYIPMKKNGGVFEKVKCRINPNRKLDNLKKTMKRVVDEVNPDLIQVFGTEWPYGYVADLTNIPIVIHIMGALVQYVNALYPPGFSYKDLLRILPLTCRIKKVLFPSEQKEFTKRVDSEKQIWGKVQYYMGRTDWDKNLSKIMSPNRIYFHVEEALRSDFFSNELIWDIPHTSKIKIISTGCSTFWKGPDMLLQTAKILKEKNVDFEWIVAGEMCSEIKSCVEKHFRTTYKENHVKLIGYTQPLELKKLLCESTMYVHTAYVENSPNSICEAQLLGVPVVSTYVGGIPTLLGDDGIMVPANDPWQMANAIIELAHDRKKMSVFSKNGRKRALERHDKENVKRQLFACYNEMLKERA